MFGDILCRMLGADRHVSLNGQSVHANNMCSVYICVFYFETVLNVLRHIFAVQAHMNVHHVFQQIDLLIYCFELIIPRNKSTTFNPARKQPTDL